MSKNLFRLYVSSGPDGLISLSSIDGKSFSFEGTIIQGGGGMVGAILLPDNRVRLFLEGGTPPNNPGLISMISMDGRHFVAEDGYRILKPAEYFNINNPQPIKLSNGDYLMLYQLSKQDNPDAEIHLATSKNGYDWIIDPRIIGYGGTCCLIQAANGTLFIYNANLTPKI
jgi:hypothetical protein